MHTILKIQTWTLYLIRRKGKHTCFTLNNVLCFENIMAMPFGNTITYFLKNLNKSFCHPKTFWLKNLGLFFFKYFSTFCNIQEQICMWPFGLETMSHPSFEQKRWIHFKNKNPLKLTQWKTTWQIRVTFKINRCQTSFSFIRFFLRFLRWNFPINTFYKILASSWKIHPFRYPLLKVSRKLWPRETKLQ